MDHFSAAADPVAASRLECADVIAILDRCDVIGDDLDEMARRIASHVESCDACRTAFDALAPEQTLSPLTTRLGRAGRAEAVRLGVDVQGETAATAFLLIERGYAMKTEHTPKANACEVIVLAETRGTTPTPTASPGTACFEGQFLPGQMLEGVAGKYVIQGLKKATLFSETYEATVQGFVAGSDVQAQNRVVIRIPRVASDMSDETAARQLDRLAALLQNVVITQRRLQGSEHVAQLIDHGEYDHRLVASTSRSVFVVYRYIDGVDLATYMRREHGGHFTGLSRARDFFDWARKLIAAVDDMHQRLLVHGDISPVNIIVEHHSGRPVLVDLGESLFVQAMNDLDGRHKAYRAPDSEVTPSSDLFSVGGVLYFLATGLDPHGLGQICDIDMQKEQIEARIREVNPNLFEEEGGVVDVIRRCLRMEGRVQHADQLLEDIELCDPTTVSAQLVEEVDGLRRVARDLDSAGNALFHWVAGLRLRALAETLQDMNRGVLDFSGDPKAICSAACALMRGLTEGDEYLSFSLPQFWHPRNMGIDGRFQTTNRMAAARGARIRRILVLDEEFSDEYLDEIVAAQRKLAADLAYSPNCQTKYIVMAPEARKQFVREGKHVGLFMRQDDHMAMFPVYRELNTLVMLRFRTDPVLVHGLRDVFDSYFESAMPLADLRLPSLARTRGIPTLA